MKIISVPRDVQVLFLAGALILITACSSNEDPATLAETETSVEQQQPTEAGATSESTAVGQNEDGIEDKDETPEATAEAKTDAPSEDADPPEYAGTIPAPEFPTNLDWLNTDRALSLADLRGKVVLLDFWTYGCINCIHIIPDLKRLEEKYADELVVIGVHSAKFENEGETENIRNVILRYELEHPVVNDKDFQVWNTYGARAWPTLVLIDPDGNVLGFHSGEGIYNLFDEVIAGMVTEFDERGRIDRTPLDLRLEREEQLDSPLLFPGKVLADEPNNRIFIADSNHNRLVISDLQGNVLEVIGNGRADLADGDYESASFFRPQGLALADDNTLYVADTENNIIRRVDLADRQVTTVAGIGEQVYTRIPGGPALSTPLNSPWDVLYHEGILYIAMAGQHQIWSLDIAEETLYGFAGSGREELADGRLLSAGLNQPSGLATDGNVLYIADSEASAIRAADLDPEGSLETIVGTGLFDFGDVDGQGDEVRLQHPLGVVYDEGILYIADTYNSKIKKIDPEKSSSDTFIGSGESGWQDGTEALFDEPGGLSLGQEKLYIADTNNHVIRIADLETREVSTLVLIDNEGLLTRQAAGEEYSGTEITLETQEVSPGSGEIVLDVVIPDGYKVNDLAPFSMEWESSGSGVSFDDAEANKRIVEPSFPLTIPAEFGEGESELKGDLVVYYCEAEAQSLCLIERVRVTAPFSVAEGGQQELLVSHIIPEPTE